MRSGAGVARAVRYCAVLCGTHGAARTLTSRVSVTGTPSKAVAWVGSDMRLAKVVTASSRLTSTSGGAGGGAGGRGLGGDGRGLGGDGDGGGDGGGGDGGANGGAWAPAGVSAAAGRAGWRTVASV